MFRSRVDLALVFCAASAACGGVSDPLPNLDWSLESFRAQPLPPVAGEEVRFSIAGKYLGEVEIYQGSERVYYGLNVWSGTTDKFVAVSSEVPEIVARGRKGPETKMAATLWDESCFILGTWTGTASVYTEAGPPNCGADDLFKEVSITITENIFYGRFNEYTTTGNRDQSVPCRYAYYVDNYEGATVALEQKRPGEQPTLWINIKKEDCNKIWSAPMTREE